MMSRIEQLKNLRTTLLFFKEFCIKFLIIHATVLPNRMSNQNKTAYHDKDYQNSRLNSADQYSILRLY